MFYGVHIKWSIRTLTSSIKRSLNGGPLLGRWGLTLNNTLKEGRMKLPLNSPQIFSELRYRPRAVIAVDVPNLWAPSESEIFRFEFVRLYQWLQSFHTFPEGFLVYLGRRRFPGWALRGLRVTTLRSGNADNDGTLIHHSRRALREANGSVEFFVLVSGDGDYIPLVREAQTGGYKVVVISRRRSLSRRLMEAADYVELFENLVKRR